MELNIVPFIGAFIAIAMFLFLPVGLILPEKYNKWFWQILFTVSMIITIIFMNQKEKPKPIIKEPVVKKESSQQKDAKYCLREERQKGRNKEDAEQFCYYECIVDIMDFGGENFIGAQVECEDIFED